eukprot:EG_transcript_19609
MAGLRRLRAYSAPHPRGGAAGSGPAGRWAPATSRDAPGWASYSAEPEPLWPTSHVFHHHAAPPADDLPPPPSLRTHGQRFLSDPTPVPKFLPTSAPTGFRSGRALSLGVNQSSARVLSLGPNPPGHWDSIASLSPGDRRPRSLSAGPAPLLRPATPPAALAAPAGCACQRVDVAPLAAALPGVNADPQALGLASYLDEAGHQRWLHQGLRVFTGYDPAVDYYRLEDLELCQCGPGPRSAAAAPLTRCLWRKTATPPVPDGFTSILVDDGLQLGPAVSAPRRLSRSYSLGAGAPSHLPPNR